MGEDNNLNLCFDKGLELQTKSGNDLTPRGAKDFALLIILMFSPGLYQTRDMLRKTLWLIGLTHKQMIVCAAHLRTSENPSVLVAIYLVPIEKQFG